MNKLDEPILGDITLCLVILGRHGNVANVLQSVNRVVSHMIVIDAGGGGGQAVKHLAGEYDAEYIVSPAEPDESILLNSALDKVKTRWALFLSQQEVLHLDDPTKLFSYLDDQDAIAFNMPVIRLNEPNNYHFETRIIDIHASVRWEHSIYPSLDESLDRAVANSDLGSPVKLIQTSAIVSLGIPEQEEWELRDSLVRIEKELDIDPKSAKYWYHRALISSTLEEWDRSHSAIEEGLAVVSQQADLANREPDGVNGLIGMFCEILLKNSFFPEKTIESLSTIFHHISSDGRFSVPLGRILITQNRRPDAINLQNIAIENYFSERHYHLPLEVGLFKPAQLLWELESQISDGELLRSVIDLQGELTKRKFDLQVVLQYIFEHNEPLFNQIQKVLQRNLGKYGS